MKKFISLLLISFSALCLYGWSWSTQIHGMATSDDGKWNAVSILEDKTKEESIWVFKSDSFWDSPKTLITFTSQGGWSMPSVCYDKHSKSFFVYHNGWKYPEEGGLYEFPFINEKYSSKKFHHTSFEKLYLGYGKLLANNCGIYLLSSTGKWTGKEDRKCKLYKLSIKEDHSIDLVIPSSLEKLQFANLDWRGEEKGENPSVLRDVYDQTENGLILKDADEVIWWHFDCETEKLTQFDSKNAALEYDKTLEEEKSISTKVSKVYLYAAILLCAVLLVIVFILIFVNKRKGRHISIDDLNTKEKNKFIFSIQEKERSKISRDIHDSVVQDIRVLRLETENLIVHEESEALQTKIEDIATDCIVKLRNICYNLSPAELMEHTDGDSSEIELVSIINSLAQQFISRTHVPCTVGVEEGFEFPPLEKEVTQNLFRVVQEALTNIEKHSYATETSIFIKKENANIVIYITDDGIGCSQEKINSSLKSKDHLGLRSMKDRMDLIGGKIDFISTQDDGMEVRIELGTE